MATEGQATRTIVVLGDLMLDVNEKGSVDRVSPEGPVIILLNPTVHEALGGAGNTAANAHTLGCAVTMVSVVGDDEAGRRCDALAVDAGLTSRLVVAQEYRTTTKTRYLARGQQIMRLDRESESLPPQALTDLLAVLDACLDGADALIISDYDKGVVTPEVARASIEAARAKGVPIVVDSKKLDLTCFEGVSVITPNLMEASRATREDDPERAARAIAAITKGAVMVTLGPDGMMVLEDDTATHLRSGIQEVSDVTGAGDTVSAAVAVAIAQGTERVVDAADWANRAAEVAVTHRGTYAVPLESVRGPLPWPAD